MQPMQSPWILHCKAKLDQGKSKHFYTYNFQIILKLFKALKELLRLIHSSSLAKLKDIILEPYLTETHQETAKVIDWLPHHKSFDTFLKIERSG